MIDRPYFYDPALCLAFSTLPLGNGFDKDNQTKANYATTWSFNFLENSISAKLIKYQNLLIN